MSFLPTAPMRAYRRSRTEIQLGLGSPRGLIVGDLDPAEASAIVALGSMHACQWTTTSSSRPPSARWHEVLACLQAASRQLQPEVPTADRIVVTGRGPVPDAIAATLRDLATDVVTDDLGIARELHRDEPPDLVVIPALDALSPFAARAWHRRGVVQLPVILATDRLLIGPLVRPGEGPCTTCLDLHRAERDPAWADLVTGLADHELDAQSVTATTDLLQLAAGFVGVLTRGMLAGRALPIGVSLSIESPEPHVIHHLWQTHPACGCAADGQASVRLAT